MSFISCFGEGFKLVIWVPIGSLFLSLEVPISFGNSGKGWPPHPPCSQTSPLSGETCLWHVIKKSHNDKKEPNEKRKSQTRKKRAKQKKEPNEKKKSHRDIKEPNSTKKIVLSNFTAVFIIIIIIIIVIRMVNSHPSQNTRDILKLIMLLSPATELV